MAKRALCVGVNDYPGEENDLLGCVNDANAWANLLISDFAFPSSAVCLLTDSQATKANIMAALGQLLEGARRGDILVFTNSSHGTYVADTSGDEPKADEAICPYDAAENLIVDDDLRELFSGLPAGVHLTVISDSCHSGTVTRVINIPGQPPPPPEHYRRPRFLRPAALGLPQLTDEQLARIRRRPRYPQSRMKDLLLSGCMDTESSFDAFIDGNYHGAMTYYALSAIRAANCHISYEQLHMIIGTYLTLNGYAQRPQLEGRPANKKRQVFS